MTKLLPCPFHGCRPQINAGPSDAPYDPPWIGCSVVYRDETGADHVCGCCVAGVKAWNTRALAPEAEPPGTRERRIVQAASAVVDHYKRIHKGQRSATAGMTLLARLETAMSTISNDCNPPRSTE